MLVLDTRKGQGVKAVEDMEFNHHINVSAQMADEAIAELERGL